MKKLIQPILIVLLVFFSIDINAQNNRRDAKKSVAHRSTYNRISAGASHNLEIRNGTLWAWGANGSGQLGDGTNESSAPKQIGTENKWVSISGGSNHSIAIKSDGTLWAWGANYSGQSGNPNVQNIKTPRQIGSENNWISIAAGEQYSLALKSNGTLWAWGSNSHGQLGIGTFRDTARPVQIGTDTKWVSISAGFTHSFGIKSDGTLWAWGCGQQGLLGDGGNSANRNTPVQLAGNNWVSIEAGYSHSLGIKSDGTLWAWGNDDNGKLGDGGTNTIRYTPIQIGSEKWVSIAVADNHSLGIKSDGTLWAWGGNYEGQLGIGNTENRNSPSQIGADKNWVGIAAGSLHSLGIKSDGTLRGWGDQSGGQLGTGNYDVYTPARITSDNKWVKIATGHSHSLGIKTDGTLWAWGINREGELGFGHTETGNGRPAQVGTDNNWVSIAAGFEYSLGIKSNGTLWAWGGNNFGQLGIGTNRDTSLPVQVGTGTNWKSIEAEGSHALAIKTDGTLWAWGHDNFGQLGDGGTYTNRNAPVQIGTSNNWVSIAAGLYHSLALTTNGTLWAWGYSYFGGGNIPIQAGTSNNWVSITAGGEHSLAIKTDGTLWAWGKNDYSQLGNGTVENQFTPVQIGTDNKWVSISAGRNHSHGVKIDGTLWAWGANWSGQLGNGNTPANTPVQIGTDTKWLRIAGGDSHSLGIKTDGTLWSWGADLFGQLGNGDPNEIIHTPIPIGIKLSGWLSISAGENFSLGLKENGTLWAWGLNDKGQLGIGATKPSSYSPIQVSKATNWIGIAAGSTHALGLQADGTLWAWGNNEFGQLGDNSTINRLSPVKIGTDNDWVSIAAGDGHSVALKSDGTLWTWGRNDKGQLGNKTNTDSKSPKADQLSGWVSIAAGYNHTLALKSDGTLWACGNNASGQLGDGTNSNNNLFVQAGTDNTWISIACGKLHNLGLKANGTLWSWGVNETGQLGNGTTNPRNTPGQVGNDNKWITIAGGWYHSLGIQSNGTLWALGFNQFGQLGNNQTTPTQRTSPIQIGNEKNWISIAGGGLHSLALKSDRTGFCATGYNKYGQLGTGTDVQETIFAGYLDPFVLLAKTKINLDSNSYVIKRGVGVTDTLGSINVINNSTVSDSSSYARSVNIIINSGASVISSIFSAATAKFPLFKDNPFSDSALDHSVNANATVTLTDSVYKNLTIGSNAMVTFTQPRIYVRDFASASNVTLKFSHCSELRIGNKIMIGSNNQFNPDMKGLIIYSAGSISIDKGTTANVSVYTLDKLSVSGLSSSRVSMKGLFLANEIESKYTSWNWNNFDVCESALVSVKPIVKNDIGFKVFPNPNEGRFRMELNSPINAPLQISITDYLGREVYQTSQPVFSGSNSMEIDLNQVLSACYILKVQIRDQTFYKKIMVVK